MEGLEILTYLRLLECNEEAMVSTSFRGKKNKSNSLVPIDIKRLKYICCRCNNTFVVLTLPLENSKRTTSLSKTSLSKTSPPTSQQYPLDVPNLPDASLCILSYSNHRTQRIPLHFGYITNHNREISHSKWTTIFARKTLSVCSFSRNAS
jgi:hypothetical protein